MPANPLAAPCGIHCGLCPMHRAVGDEGLRKLLSQQRNMPEEKVGCAGCRGVDGHCPVIGEQCVTYVCSLEKGVEFCSDCPEFPCQKLMPCADRADRLPHNLKICSLTLRKMKGEEAWEKAVGQAYSLYYDGKMVVGRGPQPKESPAATVKSQSPQDRSQSKE